MWQSMCGFDTLLRAQKAGILFMFLLSASTDATFSTCLYRLLQCTLLDSPETLLGGHVALVTGRTPLSLTEEYVGCCAGQQTPLQLCMILNSVNVRGGLQCMWT